jgi:hypothetical protein
MDGEARVEPAAIDPHRGTGTAATDGGPLAQMARKGGIMRVGVTTVATRRPRSLDRDETDGAKRGTAMPETGRDGAGTLRPKNKLCLRTVRARKA